MVVQFTQDRGYTRFILGIIDKKVETTILTILLESMLGLSMVYAQEWASSSVVVGSSLLGPRTEVLRAKTKVFKDGSDFS